MNNPTIRPFAASDADAIIDLSLDAWAPVFASFKAGLGGDLYARVHPDWRTDQAASVRTALDDSDTWFAEADGIVAGFVNVIFNADRSREIYVIAVDPAAQRRGIASPLTDHALEEMRTRGIDLGTRCC